MRSKCHRSNLKVFIKVKVCKDEARNLHKAVPHIEKIRALLFFVAFNLSRRPVMGKGLLRV